MKAPARRPPGLRQRLLLSVLVTVALGLAGLTAVFNLVLAERLGAQATGVAQARASAELGALRVSGGKIAMPEAPDDRSPDARVWVFEGGNSIEAPRATALEDRAALALAGSAPATRDLAKTATRLYSVPVAVGHRRIGAVVAAVSLRPYTQTRRTSLIGSIVLALAAFMAAAVGARWLISRALRPVARMTRQASEWSEHDLDRRFSQGPARDELTQLASTLDGLLDRLAASLRHEQRLSAELSHELRTPLANIAAQAQYALRHGAPSQADREALEQILKSTEEMRKTLVTLIAASRAQLDLNRATSDPAACGKAAVTTCAPLAANRAIELSLQVSPRAPRVAVEQHLVERILVPLIENACHHAEERIGVSVGWNGYGVRFVVEDDGPGVPDQEIEAVFVPGHRAGDPQSPTRTMESAGLGLALARRLARTAGGEVTAERSEEGGRFVVVLPAAMTTGDQT